MQSYQLLSFLEGIDTVARDAYAGSMYCYGLSWNDQSGLIDSDCDVKILHDPRQVQLASKYVVLGTQKSSVEELTIDKALLVNPKGSEFEFEVPAGVVSFLIAVEGVDFANTPNLLIDELTDPEGTQIVASQPTKKILEELKVPEERIAEVNSALWPTFSKNTSRSLVPAAYTIQVSNSRSVYPFRTHVPSGRYKARISVLGSKPFLAKIRVFQKKATVEPKSGSLILNLYGYESSMDVSLLEKVFAT